MKTEIKTQNLLEAGVQFGHQTKRWNPKMAEYIYTAKNGIHIIDLQKSLKGMENAYSYLKNRIEKTNGSVLFVGTKKQAAKSVEEAAKNCGQFYVTSSWKGGTLTNNRVVRKSIQKMESIERMEEDGTFDKLPKKEVIQLKKDHEKLVKFFGGIREMNKRPSVMVVFDVAQELNAIKEAKKLNIPVIALVDTNVDPELVDVVIPGNDDAIGAIKLVADVLANAVLEANGKETLEIKPAKKPERKQFDNRRNFNNDRNDRRAPRREEAPKAAPKAEEVKTETVDIESMKVAELKEYAATKGIKLTATKKADIIAEIKAA